MHFPFIHPSLSEKPRSHTAGTVSAQPQKLILLLGAYGQQNLGDDMLLEQCLRLLPREQCIVASSQPLLTQAQHAVSAIHSHKKYCTLLWYVLKTRVIVVGGGDQFKLLKPCTGRSRLASLFQCFLMTLLGRILQKPVLFIGIGIGDVSSLSARLLTVWTLKLATIVSFRERDSYNFCRRFAPRAQAYLGADLAFVGATGIKRFPKSGVRILGVAPVFQIDCTEQYSVIVRKTGMALSGFLQQNPEHAVEFLPFQTGYSTHDDIMVSREILQNVDQKHRCTIRTSFGLNNIESTYQSFDMLWGMRLHSIILSCLYAVPFIALVYNVKIQKFLEEIGYAEWSMPLDTTFSAARLLALHEKLERNLPDIRNHLREQTERLAGKAEINASLLQSLVKEVMGRAPVDASKIPVTEYPESHYFPAAS